MHECPITTSSQVLQVLSQVWTRLWNLQQLESADVTQLQKLHEATCHMPLQGTEHSKPDLEEMCLYMMQ